MAKQTIFFVGAGNMGGAIIRGLSSASQGVSDIIFLEPEEARAKELESFHAKRVSKFSEGLEKADIVVLCVKPQIFRELSTHWKSEISQSGKEKELVEKKIRIISIMAGVKLCDIKSAFENFNAEILRAMPNLPLTIGKGTIALAIDGVSEETLGIAESIFRTVGTTCRVPESQMDAVTGLSGSAPAYVFEFIEALVRGGVLAGLSRETSMKLALGTIEGSVELVKHSDKSPADLCAMVCSPAGTTIAGIQALENSAFRASVMKAIEAGTKRSKELG